MQWKVRDAHAKAVLLIIHHDAKPRLTLLGLRLRIGLAFLTSLRTRLTGSWPS